MLRSGAPDPPAPCSADLAAQSLYLRRNVQLELNEDKITAPPSSTDASSVQDPVSSSCPPTTLAHLPIELLLRIIEYVPLDYVLNWRLACRSFRDMIDGRVLFQYLCRTRLLAYIGSKDAVPKKLNDDEYEQIRMLEARLLHMEFAPDKSEEEARKAPIWGHKVAVFQIDEKWYRAFHRIGGAAKRQGYTIEDADARWINTLGRLELDFPEHRFGTLRWCIAIDHAALDLDFPTERSQMHFDIRIDLEARQVIVVWKDMLFTFLKTQRALRLLLDEKYTHSTFTFRHSEEDCLRAVRRARFSASLDPSDKLDRSLLRSLRLPPSLYGFPNPLRCWFGTSSDIETDAIQQLLQLRRSAALSSQRVSCPQDIPLLPLRISPVLYPRGRP